MQVQQSQSNEAQSTESSLRCIMLQTKESNASPAAPTPTASERLNQSTTGQTISLNNIPPVQPHRGLAAISIRCKATEPYTQQTLESISETHPKRHRGATKSS
ncbi:hypothetical protein Nepgr_014783 [Nepenthes gracilis]|uniref:Uncharacterized protein n=1 Tax=Nepenthes gracilis TaxID=150966 RepID=A0AAD3XPT7_NEPGR|nr:hypothetical protein Nepgr_014783 [Nepenthes gracilis]